MREIQVYLVRTGTRRIVLLQGPFGWGEVSFVEGYPCSPSAAWRAALECAASPWPAPLRARVEVNALVANWPVDRRLLEGFACVKVKLGSREPLRDVEVVSELRDLVGPRVAIRVDANGRWDESTAEWVLERLERCGIELAEQPVRGIEAMARLRRRVNVPLAADECVRSVTQARRLRALGAADAIVLKLAPLGGFRAALDIAEAAGVHAIVSSMMETSVGLAAGLHLAAALPETPYACGLGTAGMAGEDVTDDPLLAKDGMLEVRRVVPDLRYLVEPLDCKGPDGFDPTPLATWARS